jgi:hypothetical protein
MLAHQSSVYFRITYVALPANHLITVVLHRQRLERRLDQTTTQPQNQVQRRLLLDIVVGEGAAVFELLAREDEALLVWRYALLVLDLGLHIVDRVAGLHLEGDSLAREGLDKAVEEMLVWASPPRWEGIGSGGIHLHCEKR